MTSLVLGLAVLSPAHPPRPLPPPPSVIVEAPPPVIAPAPAVFTVKEFARAFQPIPGHHTVWLDHPKTCRPVKVCFDLPPGCPKVKASKHRLEFDYGKCEVTIRFRHNGAVDVDYDD
jgi:hypothetical protein